MMGLRPPGLGPLIGHTTDRTCRIWIRAGDPGDHRADLDEDRRTVGVIGIVRDNGIGEAWYFRLNREFDRTGTFRLGFDVQLGFFPQDFAEQGKAAPDSLPAGVASAPLTPDTDYVVRVGTLTLDDPTPNAARMPDWKLITLLPDIGAIKGDLLELDPEQSEARFRTFPASGTPATSLCFLLGSCRYPGLLWKIKEADRIFGPMRAHFESDNPFGEPARFTMMCGDQVYADALNRHVPLLRADTYAEFQERYLTAFGAPNLRRLLRTSTTYMILDDHEIEDNWTQDRINDAGAHQLFNLAISAYMTYEWSHGPRTWGRHLYYTFESAGYPFFVLDTRTQRFKNNVDDATDKGLRDNHLLGFPNIDAAHPGQLQRLLDWLSEQQRTRGNGPKFVVTSSVFVPNAMDERIEAVGRTVPDAEWQWYEINRAKRDRSDSWPAFPNTRRAIVDLIVKEQIQNVVFLAGDVHCSNVAEIDFERVGGEPGPLPLKAFAVTSSAFYWPFPFADGDPNGFVHDSRQPAQWDPFPVLDGSVQMHYRAYAFTQEDNFARLDLDKARATLTLRIFDRDGHPVRVADRADQLVTAIVLPLAAW